MIMWSIHIPSKSCLQGSKHSCGELVPLQVANGANLRIFEYMAKLIKLIAPIMKRILVLQSFAYSVLSQKKDECGRANSFCTGFEFKIFIKNHALWIYILGACENCGANMLSRMLYVPLGVRDTLWAD